MGSCMWCNKSKVLLKVEDGRKTANIVDKEILTVEKTFILMTTKKLRQQKKTKTINHDNKINCLGGGCKDCQGQ